MFSLVDLVTVPVALCTLFSLLRTKQLISSVTSSFEDSADEEYNFATRVVCWQEFFALLLDILAICAAIPCALSVVRLPQLVVDLASAAGDEDEWRSACFSNLFLLVPSIFSTGAGVTALLSVVRTPALIMDLTESGDLHKAVRPSVRESEHVCVCARARAHKPS